jgi:YD repeat-containing protein
MTVQGQPTVNYEYDGAGRLTNVNTLIDAQPTAFQIGYDDLGRRSTITFPNSVISSYAYDNVSHLLALQHTAPGNHNTRVPGLHVHAEVKYLKQC